MRNLKLFNFLINFAISRGEVFNLSNDGILPSRLRLGAGSSKFGTVDLEAKYSLNKLIFCNGS